MDRNKKEQASGIFLLLFSVFVCFFSYKLSIGDIHNPGGGFFPFYLGIILALLSIINIAKAIVRRKGALNATEASGAGINWKNIIVTVVVLFGYPPLLGILGFPLSTFLFTVIFLRFIEPQRWTVVLGTGGAVTLFFYVVFQYWLKIQFPAGIFGV
jgi:putative tricarboxylic transport membrane protein